MSVQSADQLLHELREHMTITTDFFKFKGVTDEFEKLRKQIKIKALKNPEDPLKELNDKMKAGTGNTQVEKPWYKNITKKIIRFVNDLPEPTYEKEKVAAKDYYDLLKQKGGTVTNFSEQISEAQKNVTIDPVELKAAQVAIQEKFHYEDEGSTIISEEVLEKGLGINNNEELCFKEANDNDIDLDNEEINDMVLAAKTGNFDGVFSILDRKPYIVNCIPEERAWSALHQAIFLGSFQSVVKLVDGYGADVSIFTKTDRAAAAKPGTDALSLAFYEGNKDIYDFLLMHSLIHLAAGKRQDISYVTLHKNGIVYPFQKYPLFRLTLASYKGLFMKSKSRLDSNKHIVHILKDVITNVDKSWEDARDKLRNTLYGIDRSLAEDLLRTTSKEQFFQMILRFFTEQRLYHIVNSALVRQANTPYKPLAADLAVGPFALILSTILLNWEILEPYSGKTYRGVCSDVTDKYKPGQTFLFSHFVASSQSKRVAEFYAGEVEGVLTGTIFVFDNSAKTNWRPRSIKHLSKFPDEEECLFPLGAEFQVESVNKEAHEIHLKLLDPAQ